MARIDELLSKLKDCGGSDLHLTAGMEPRIRIHGELESVEGWSVLDDGGLRELIRPLASPAQWARFESCSDLDFAYGLEGVARFRANYFVQERGAGAVFRMIPERIIPLEDLLLPKAIERFVHLEHGLVLVTGPTGSGKSTTLAAIIDKINRTYRRHIVTLEDPVEFVHANKESVFSHREIGTHTGGFAEGLRAAIRQDADVILVGEMRDYETISLAITAAEMGLLVFGTLHTNNAPKTVDRIIDSFPSEEQDQARLSLSDSIAGIVSQLLLPTADGKGRRAVVEILLHSQALPNVIREGNTPMIHSLIQSGRSEGMQSMDDALFELVEAGEIRPHDAYMKATEKARFEPFLPQES
ncbi:MAG: type IV pilus twitching motility protein PilT [Myxococcota bacterium]